MLVEHTCVKACQPADAAVFCRGRMLSSAELLGLPDQRSTSLRTLPLLLASWLVLTLVATVPLIGLANLFAAPLLFGRRDSRSRQH